MCPVTSMRQRRGGTVSSRLCSKGATISTADRCRSWTPTQPARTVLHHLAEWGTAWQHLRSPSGLADYGGIKNLLECVSTYVHEVASLNAANVWCLRVAAETHRLFGKADGEAEQLAAAAELAGQVGELYFPGRGHWRARHPDGPLVLVRHGCDFG